MALESAEILSKILIDGIRNEIESNTMVKQYISQWNNHFNVRLLSARLIQKSILMNSLRKAGTSLIKLYPSILPRLVMFTRS